jgi:oligopeptide transport system substrate-binding protein
MPSRPARAARAPARTLLPLLCALLALALSACPARRSPVETALDDHTLHLGNGAEPGDLDPQLAVAYTEYNILIALGEGLTAIDEQTGRPVPAAAFSWTLSDDGLRYTFTLRPEARWSDGSPVLARDFLFAYQRILRPRLASPYAYMLFPVRGAEDYHAGRVTDFAQVGFSAPDERTLIVELTAPTPYFLGLVAHQAWFPVHPPTILKHGSPDQRGTAWTRPGNHVGNGAYRLTLWRPNDRIEVERQPHHYSDPALGPRRIVFYPTENVTTDEAAYRAGQRHATYGLAPERIATYRAQTPSPLRIDPLLETSFLRFNVTRPPLDDRRVRQALALAIDRETLAQNVYLGSRVPATQLAPPGIGGYRGEPRQTHAPDTARSLLADAGYPAGRGFPRLELIYHPSSFAPAALEAIQAMWRRELGVEIALGTQDFHSYLDAMQSLRYDLAGARWIGDYDDPNTYLDLFLTDGGNNLTGWSHPDYDALIARAATPQPDTPRLAVLQQAETLLLTEAPIAPIVFGARVHLLHPDVKNWFPSLLGVRRYQTLLIRR